MFGSHAEYITKCRATVIDHVQKCALRGQVVIVLCKYINCHFRESRDTYQQFLD
jgi:hypothetical protein